MSLFFFLLCAFHLIGNPLLLVHDPIGYFELNKKLLKFMLVCMNFLLIQYIIKSFFALFRTPLEIMTAKIGVSYLQ